MLSESYLFRYDVNPSLATRRVIGPERPSPELILAAAAQLREAAELDDGSFIGPAPPAMVREAASANEAERFEEMARIIAADQACLYDVLGVNHNMSAQNINKRYWKLSLMVHPDKCPHPQAQQAFVKLNQAYKDLQDPVKRKVLDDKIKEKGNREVQAELKSMLEAAQWRLQQGISMEGDAALLAEMDVKIPPARDEWMTTLPPERRPAPGVSMQSTRAFSKTAKESRGDTSAWTDKPSGRPQKAKTNLEAYNEAAAAALPPNELEKKRVNSADAALIDKYNKGKRSKSLVEKHQESMNRLKKKSKHKKSKESLKEWEGNHPWSRGIVKRI